MVRVGEKLTVEDLEVRAVVVPFRRPLATRVGYFSEWPLILVDLHTAEGISGRGYLAPYIKQSVAYIVPALRDLAELMRGQEVAPVQTYQETRASLGLVGYQGVSTIAVAGFDMACWDALAKAAGLPLVTLLGGTVGPVGAYNSNGLGLIPPEKVAEEALELVEEGGFRALKVRVGRDALEDDIAALRNVRGAVGEEVVLVCDFNQGLTLGEAMQRCRALDEEGVYWIEEPIDYDNLEGNAKLVRETATPIQIGENFYGPRAMYEAIQAGACDYVMPDLMRIGGVTGWLRAAAIASAAGIDMSTHLYPEISGHLLRVTPTAHWLEWQDWAHPILAEPFEVEDGHVHVRDVPGNGLEWDEDAVSYYRFEA
ncbi:MAG: enolase C-terminal domain-like protein [Rubrobacteraceae bacterium]